MAQPIDSENDGNSNCIHDTKSAAAVFSVMQPNQPTETT